MTYPISHHRRKLQKMTLSAILYQRGKHNISPFGLFAFLFFVSGIPEGGFPANFRDSRE
jgi:hypothetical protein